MEPDVKWNPRTQNDDWFNETLRLPGAQPGELSTDQIRYFQNLTEYLNEESTQDDVVEFLYAPDCTEIRKAFLAAPSNELTAEAKAALKKGRKKAHLEQERLEQERDSEPKDVATSIDVDDLEIDQKLRLALGYPNLIRRKFTSSDLKLAKQSGTLGDGMRALHQLRKADEAKVVSWLKLKRNSAVEKAFEAYLLELNKLGRSNSLTDGSTRTYAKAKLGSAKLRGGSRLTPKKTHNLKKEYAKAKELAALGKPGPSPLVLKWALNSKLKTKVVCGLLEHQSKCALSTKEFDMAMRALANLLLTKAESKDLAKPHICDVHYGDDKNSIDRSLFRKAFREWVEDNIRDKGNRKKLLDAVPLQLKEQR